MDEKELLELEARVKKAEASIKASEEKAEMATKKLDLEMDKKKLAEAKLENGKADDIVRANLKTFSPNSNSFEKETLRRFGVRDAKSLMEINTEDAKYRGVPAEFKHTVRQLKEDFDVSRMIQQVIHGENTDKGESTANVKGMLEGSYFARDILAPKLKAFGTSVVGGGAEWIPNLISNQFLDEFELDLQVVKQFKSINMPSSPFTLPVKKGNNKARRQVESCDRNDNVAPTNFNTDKIVFDAEKLVEHICLPEELNEDSAPQILAMNRMEVTEAQFRSWESGILNGDTSAVHMDNDITGVVNSDTAWDGLRRLALANSASVDFGGAPVLAKTREMRRLMGKYGVGVRNLVWIASIISNDGLLSIPEVVTVDKMGSLATILNGALAALDGIPIITSEYQRDDLDATGVNSATPANNVKSSLILVNKSRFMFGIRRPVRVRATIDPLPPSDRWILASSWRGDFQGATQDANETSVVLGYNIV